MGSITKFTKTRRRIKATKRALLRTKKANKLLSRRKKTGFNPVLSV